MVLLHQLVEVLEQLEHMEQVVLADKVRMEQ